MKTMIVDHGKRDLIAWKSEYEDFQFGTRLVVHESQQAVFFRDGQAIEVLGPGMHVLETGNFPFLQKLVKLRFGKYFHCEVYFVNHSVQMSIQWGTDSRVNAMLQVEDGKSLPLSIGASGTINLQIDPGQVQKFLTYLLGSGVSLSNEEIRLKFRSMLMTVVKSYLGRTLQGLNYNVFTLDQHMLEISEALLELVRPEFEKYGIIVREFFVDNIVLPEDNHAFQEARLLYEQRYAQHGKLDLELDLKQKEAEREIALAGLEAQKKITEANAEAQITVLKAQGEAERRRLEGISSIQEHQFDTLNRMADSGAGVSGNMPSDGTNTGNIGGFIGSS